MQTIRRPKPRRPSRRLAALAASGAVFMPISAALAAPPAAADAALSSKDSLASELRLGPSRSLAEEVRRPPAIGRSRTLAPAPERTFYEGPDQGVALDRRRLDDLDGIAPGEAPPPPEPAEEPFDLLESPEPGPAARGNFAAAPAPPGGLYGDPSPSAESAKTEGSLLIDAQRRNVRALDLAVPTGTATSRVTDGIGGRVNLPITGLRPSVPLARDDAFAPIGIRASSFVLYSTLDQGFGASSNLSRTPGGVSGAFSETELSARLLSDWSRHQAELNGLVAYRRNFEGSLESDPRLSLDGRLRLDIDRLTAATLTGAVQYRRQDPIDLLPGEAASDRPDILTYSAGAKLERGFGRAKLGLDLASLREKTEANHAGDTPRLDETYTTTTAGLRAGYELSPAVQPFVAGSIGRRVFDEERSLSGLERASLIEALRGGVAFDLGEKFFGEVAAGYAWNVPDDSRLGTTSAPTLDARIAWSPRRGTDLVLSTATSFEPDTLTASTSTLYEGAIALRHRWTARTDLTGTLSAAYRDADIESERERRYAAEAGFVHWLNRSLAVTGLVRHERLDSETPGGSYDADSIRVGLRLQR